MLPFVNLSSDKEQEFFSDGMTEEITSALAKISNLRVVGRTSAFQFKGENKDLRAIGQALSATHLIEGSVRKDGNEVRITAQLIRADDGTHLWTESYDRELKGVFASQEESPRPLRRAASAAGVETGRDWFQTAPAMRSPTRIISAPRRCIRARAAKPLTERLPCWNRWSRAIPIMRPPGPCWLRPMHWSPIMTRRITAARSQSCGALRTVLLRKRKPPPAARSNWTPAMPMATRRWVRSKRIASNFYGGGFVQTGAGARSRQPRYVASI